MPYRGDFSSCLCGWRVLLLQYVGHTLVVDDDGDFAVAEETADGTLVASEIKYVGQGQRLPDGTPSHLRPHKKKDCLEELCSERQMEDFFSNPNTECKGDNPEHCKIVLRRHLETQRRRTAVVTKGTVKNLVIPFRFSDHADRTLPSRNDISLLMNGSTQDCSNNPSICGSSGSVRTYYSTMSHDQLTLDSVVVDWVDIQTDEKTAAAGNSG